VNKLEFGIILFAAMKPPCRDSVHPTRYIKLKGYVVPPLKNYIKKWREQSRQMSAVSLLTELKRAGSLLDIASHTVDPGHRENLGKEALKSYNAAILSLSREFLTATERAEIDKELDSFRTRLRRFEIIIERDDGVARKVG
jgi:hypothetical protein